MAGCHRLHSCKTCTCPKSVLARAFHLSNSEEGFAVSCQSSLPAVGFRMTNRKFRCLCGRCQS